MDIVNITDIEDLVLSKVKIEKILKDNEKIDKLELSDYINKYCNLANNTFLYYGVPYPFNYLNIYGESFLYITEKGAYLEVLINKLNDIQFDLTKLKSISTLAISENYEAVTNGEFFIINGKYYE